MGRHWVIYDTELKNGVSTPDSINRPGFRYCNGWEDYEAMGIAVICAYDYFRDEYRVFLEDNLQEFERLANQTEMLIGFNSWKFDDNVCRANGLKYIVTGYDILLETWKAAGLEPDFHAQGHMGYNLDVLAQANGILSKRFNGALAPIYWQMGKPGIVIDYCLRDVKTEKQIFDLIVERGELVDPERYTNRLKFASVANRKYPER